MFYFESIHVHRRGRYNLARPDRKAYHIMICVHELDAFIFKIVFPQSVQVDQNDAGIKIEIFFTHPYSGG